MAEMNAQKHINDLKNEFAERFGAELTPEQLWTLTKFAKRVRLRARNNTAFNNLCNQLFPYAKFRTVKKTKPSWRNPAIIETYDGLTIEVKGQLVEQEESED